MLRRLICLLMILLMACAGCAAQNPIPAARVSIYAGMDTSLYAPLCMVLIGDEPRDARMVAEVLSERLRDEINASLNIRYLSWQEYAIEYPLALAGAEQLDMVYTSDWCFYQTEAARGAFMELGDEFIRAYMPRTARALPAEALEQARIGGKVYMIASSGPGIEGESWIAVRGDLRERFGMEPITTQEALEVYLRRVALEEDITPYDASGEVPLFHILYEQRYNLTAVGTSYPWITAFRGDAHLPGAHEIHYRYLTEEYLDFARLMKRYYEWGFWDAEALSTGRQTRDSFEKGTSASLIWNQTIFTAGRNLEENNGAWYAEYVDLFPDTVRRLTPYTNDGTAITAFTRWPERAAMCIDILKNDMELNDLFKGGIEGVHWIDAGDGRYTPGPDAAHYPWNHAQWAFNTPRAVTRLSTERTQYEIDFELDQFAKIVHPTYENFRFDPAPVTAEWAQVTALENDYTPMLELGMTEDPEATIEEFRQRLIGAGFERVEAEFLRQYEAWKALKTP